MHKSVIDQAALSIKNTHRVDIDRFQIIRICVVRLLPVVRIECARNLKELLPEVREKLTRRDRKGTVRAMSRPPTRNIVPLDLQSLNWILSGALTLSNTHLSQERDKVLGAPPWIMVHLLPVVIVRGRRSGVHHNYPILNQSSPPVPEVGRNQ